MTASATIPFTPPRSQTRFWNPSDRDRLIFQWVKFEGHTQSWVAEQLEMNQSSVSRIVERYERWVARGGPAHAGGLSSDERLRAQRWLTYERNEWILSSALRIAGEMEQALDTSKSTISRAASTPSQETQIRTEHKVIDRSGIAARFLRLAYRVNMDQLELVEQNPLPPLEPLTIDDAEVEPQNTVGSTHQDRRVGSAHQNSDEALENETLRASVPLCETPTGQDIAAGDLSPTIDPSPMSPLHNDTITQSDLSRDNHAPCAENTAAVKQPDHAYAVATSPPETVEPHKTCWMPRTPDRTARISGPAALESWGPSGGSADGFQDQRV